MSQTKPLVMVSSVVEEFGEVRQVARLAIQAAGGQPLLVNEDFPSQAASSRNVCLDAVASSDVFTLVVGKRGGWATPSGKLVIEEEYEEAVRLHRPVLVFILGTDHDDAAKRLIQRVSDYVKGHFRTTCTDTLDFREKMEAALRPVIADTARTIMSPTTVATAIAKRSSIQEAPSLRVVVCPFRESELISPTDIDSEHVKRRVLEIGHSAGVDLLKYERATTTALAGDALLLAQQGNRSTILQASTHESGLIQVEVGLQLERENSIAAVGFASSVVAEEDIEAALVRSLRFSGKLYEQFDPYGRHQSFWFNCVLLGLSYRTIERNPQPRSSFTMNTMRGEQPLVAYETAREIGRVDLLDPRQEALRALAKIVRQAKG